MTTSVPRINTRVELIAFAQRHKISPNWHEPDQQDITATVEGTSFDTAGAWPLASHPDLHREAVEMYVTLRRSRVNQGRVVKGEPLAYVNLALLFAWATGFEVPSPNGDKMTEAQARDLIGQEIVEIAERYETTTATKVTGFAIGAIVRDVAEQISKMTK